MTLFRPCIDLHDGQVKQIVGSSLRDEGPAPETHFVAEQDAAWFAARYRDDGLEGGHLIRLGQGNDEVARRALAAWPGGLQMGGAIAPRNAEAWLEAGASKLIVTSWLFIRDELSMKRVVELSVLIGQPRLVIDLSCRRTDDGWRIATDRWQKTTTQAIDMRLCERLAEYCSEFLVHAADVEGKCEGIDSELVETLGRCSPIPCTYAGGARSIEDLALVESLSDGRVDLTFGSALDLFGGSGVRYEDCVAWNRAHGA